MSFFDLWLPILAAGLATHILSTLAWTVLPHHRPEWKKHPSEEALMGLVSASSEPGQFLFPYAMGPDANKSDAASGKAGKCQGMLVVWATPTNMGKAIGLTLVSFLVIAFIIGYLASMGLPKGAEFMKVFRFVTTAGLLAYIAAKFPFVFWFRRRIAMDVLDGVVFAVTTGLIFAALWPK